MEYYYYVANYGLGVFIVLLVQTIIFMTPVLILVYKQGRKDQILEEVIKDVNGLGKKVADIRNDQTTTMTELKAQVDSINQTLTRVTTQMEFMTEAIRELKK
jgi:hypothetical protein